MSLGLRLKSARQDSGFTQDYVAKALDITAQALSNYERGIRDPDTDLLKRLAGLYGTSTDYLLGRTGIKDDLPNNARPLGTTVRVPVLGTIRAGEPIIAEENIIGYQWVEKDAIKNGDYFFLKVAGDSMIGSRIYDGDLALVRKQEVVENGQIAVVLINGEEATLKKVYFSDGQVILQSDNLNYPPMVYPVKEVRILGLVVEVRFKTTGEK